MAKTDNLNDFLVDIAEGIQLAENGNLPYTINPQDFRAHIDTLKKVSGTKTITSAGTHDVSTYANAQVAAGAYTLAGGGLSGGGAVTPTVTLASGNDTNMSNITVGAKNTTNYPYYFKVGATSTSGSKTITRAAVTATQTAGYISGTTTAVTKINGDSATVTINQGSGNTYVGLKTATYTVAGGGLTSGAGTVTAAGTGITLGTATTAKPTSGKYITVTGSGKVSMAAVTATQTAGYLPATTTAKTLVSAVSNKSSNTATAYYPISSNIVDTSSGDAVAADIISGKKAWVDGKEVTGSIVEHDPSVPFEGTYWTTDENGTHIFWTTLTEKTAIDQEINFGVFGSDFGDVSSDYVPQGYTFTSDEGVGIGGKASIYDGRSIIVDPTGGYMQSSGNVYYTADIFNEYYSNDEDYQNAILNNEVSPNFLMEGGQLNIEMPADKFGNASSSSVLDGLTFTSEWGINQEGTMPDRGSVTKTLNAGGSYTIPEGYHNGSGKVTANSLASQTSGTAAASHILKDKTAWVNGSRITGTIATKTSSDLTSSGAIVTVPAGYYATVASKTISSGAATVSGGGLSASTGSVSATSGGVTLIATASKPSSGYYITATGSGKVSQATITLSKSAGYIAGGASTYKAATTISSSTATAHYVISTQEKEVNPTTSQQIITPDSGRLLSQVIVNGYTESGLSLKTYSVKITSSVGSATAYYTAGDGKQYSKTLSTTQQTIYVAEKTTLRVVGPSSTYCTLNGGSTLYPVTDENNTACIYFPAVPLLAEDGGNVTLTLDATAAKVDTSSGDAAAANILSGKKAWVDGVEVTGTMPQINLPTPIISVNNNTGVISAAVDMEDYTPGYVFATAYSSASRRLTTKAGGTIKPSATATQTWAKGTFLTSTLTVAKEANLLPENIKAGVTICGVTGTYTGSGGATGQTVTLTSNVTDGAYIYLDYYDMNGQNHYESVTQGNNLTVTVDPARNFMVNCEECGGIVNLDRTNCSEVSAQYGWYTLKFTNQSSPCSVRVYYAS